MGTIQPDTQSGRLLCVLVDGRWDGGPEEFGNDFHTARNRINKELKEAGFPTESRRRKGKPWHEYRLVGMEVLWRARRTVERWRTGSSFHAAPGALAATHGS